jgi:hypothetical protein
MSDLASKDGVEEGGVITKHLEHERGLSEADEQMPPLDSQAEKRLVRKCDLHVLPPITLIFFLAFMDRTNIGEWAA